MRKGGAVYLDVISHNKEGFSGTITITAEGLPKGLHCTPTTINNDSRGVVVLWADKDAPEWTGPIKLTAVGKVNDITITREVRPYTRVWNSTDLNSSRPDAYENWLSRSPGRVRRSHSRPRRNELNWSWRPGRKSTSFK